MIIIVAIFAVLVLIEFALSNSIVMGSFLSLEQNDTLQKVYQADGAYQKDLQSIDALFADRAARDDSYAFMSHPQASYIEQNMGDPFFRDHDIDLLLMVDPSGDITYGKAYDTKSQTAIPIPESVRPLFGNGSSLMLTSANASASGVLVLPEGTMLVAARPIMDSRKQGLPRGTMLIGRYIDTGWVGDLANTTHLDLTMYGYHDSSLPADVVEALNDSKTEGRYVTIPLNDSVIDGYLIIDDVFGHPALVLQVEQPRPFYAKGKETIDFIILSTLGVGVVIAAIAMILLSGIVLSRLSRLDASVKAISASDDLSARVPVAGNDELGNLSGAINGMLASLEASRQMLHESEGRYHAIVEDQSELICRFRPDGTMAFANEAYRRYFGDAGGGRSFVEALPPVTRHSVEALLQSLSPAEPARVLECRFEIGGKVLWLQWSIRAIFDRQGQATEFQAVGRDVTELIKNEEQIRASLKEKDALLKEIHHRVKNNLQIISSMLSLQGARVSDPASQEVLQDSRNRIKTMALIHEKLYGSSDLSRIDMADYTTSLVNHLWSTYGNGSDRVRVRTDVEALSLNIDLAIPLGLILNELVTNSFKYAFPGDAGGEIFVELHGAGNGQYVLTVGDTGVGLPEGIDIRNTTSLGLQLVNALAEQINSNITVDRAGGTVFRITFSI
ncbi:MAG TPA: CHASE4 domain-containing protein [Methanocella sp.]|nr:CHASE4 domain-containing protein [Methanocella sp.]